MAIKQKTFTIYTVPFIQANFQGNNVIVYGGKDTPFFVDDPLASPQSNEKHKPLVLPEGASLWVAYAKSTSYEEISDIYNVLIKNVGEEYIRVSELVPIDAIIVPNS